MFGIETEVKQRVVVLAGDQSHVAAVASIAAAGSAARNEFFAPKREAAVTAVAGFDRNYDFVDKHAYLLAHNAARHKVSGYQWCASRAVRSRN
jgi:hypothetical protein